MSGLVLVGLSDASIEFAGARLSYKAVGNSLDSVTDAGYRDGSIEWLHRCHWKAVAFAMSCDEAQVTVQRAVVARQRDKPGWLPDS
jgi:hypothetical protein